jgi:hypothetical protein
MKKKDYKKGFELLVRYFDDLPDDIKDEIDRKLRKYGL